SPASRDRDRGRRHGRVVRFGSRVGRNGRHRVRLPCEGTWQVRPEAGTAPRREAAAAEATTGRTAPAGAASPRGRATRGRATRGRAGRGTETSERVPRETAPRRTAATTAAGAAATAPGATRQGEAAPERGGHRTPGGRGCRSAGPAAGRRRA